MLHQLNLHSILNTWLQWIGQRQLQDRTRNIEVLWFGALYSRGLTVDWIQNSHKHYISSSQATHYTSFVRIFWKLSYCMRYEVVRDSIITWYNCTAVIQCYPKFWATRHLKFGTQKPGTIRLIRYWIRVWKHLSMGNYGRQWQTNMEYDNPCLVVLDSLEASRIEFDPFQLL